MRVLGLFLILSLTACAPNALYISDQPDVWIKDGNTGGMYFCRANKTDKGALPICHEAAISRR